MTQMAMILLTLFLLADISEKRGGIYNPLKLCANAFSDNLVIALSISLNVDI